MPPEIIFFIISFFLLLLASIFDLRTREVPDYLSYTLLVSILGISLLYSIYTSIYFFLYALAGAAIFFILGYILYKTKQMGGADVKIFTALGAMFANQMLWDMPLLAIFSLLVLSIGSLYTFSWALVLYFKNRTAANKKAKELLAEKKKYRRALIILGLLVLLSSFLLEDMQLKILLVCAALLIILSFYLFIFIRVVESLHFIKKISVDQLTEGDWLSKEVRVHGKLICSTKEPCIDKKQIEALKKAKIEEVFIKVGIPFVPAIFLATLGTYILFFLYGIL